MNRRLHLNALIERGGAPPRLRPAAAVLLCLSMQAAHAALHLSACTVSATALNFGTYNYLSSPTLNGAGSLSVNCTCGGGGSAPYSLSLSRGGGNGFSPRSMSSGANTLSYNLYQDAAHTIVWGDGTGGSQVLSASLSACSPAPTHTIYGQVSPQPNAIPGAYADSITVTLSY